MKNGEERENKTLFSLSIGRRFLFNVYYLILQAGKIHRNAINCERVFNSIEVIKMNDSNRRVTVIPI